MGGHKTPLTALLHSSYLQQSCSTSHCIFVNSKNSLDRIKNITPLDRQTGVVLLKTYSPHQLQGFLWEGQRHPVLRVGFEYRPKAYLDVTKRRKLSSCNTATNTESQQSHFGRILYIDDLLRPGAYPLIDQFRLIGW